MTDDGTVQPALTADQLMAQIAAAGASGDITEVIRLGNLLKKQKSEVEKAESDKLQKEAEALAGDREKLANEIVMVLVGTRKQPGVATQFNFAGVKAFGFTYHVADDKSDKPYVGLLLPQVKAKKTGGGGGAGVSTKAETGLSLSELIDTYATTEQKAAIQAAYDRAEKNKPSAKWQEQVKVKRDILKEHPELIRK